MPRLISSNQLVTSVPILTFYIVYFTFILSKNVKKYRSLAFRKDPNLDSLKSIFDVWSSNFNLSSLKSFLSSPVVAWELPRNIGDREVIITCWHDVNSRWFRRFRRLCCGLLKLPQLKRSRRAHRGALTRPATAIQQADCTLEVVQAPLELHHPLL